MGYHPNVKTVRLDLGDRFNFFGPRTSLAVVVRVVLDGAERVIHEGSRTVLVDGSPLRMEPTTSVDVPTPTGGGWFTGDGAPATAWSYDVTVTATAPGRSRVVWQTDLNVPVSGGVAALNPSTGGRLAVASTVPPGSPIDPRTGGSPSGSVTVTEDPLVPGTAQIGA